MEPVIAAFATDDGNTFMNRHFGDAQQYVIYKITPTEARLIKAIGNTSEEERQHADPNKARSVGQLLKRDNVQLLASKKFGGNIQRMKQQFLCVLMNDKSIPDAVKRIQQNFDTISQEWAKGEDRHFLNLKEE